MIKKLCTILLLQISTLCIAQMKENCNEDHFSDPLLEKIIGKWNASGKVGTDKVFYNISAEWVLKHQFVRLELTDTSKEISYTADVYIGYDCMKNSYVAHWLDNFGGRMSETMGFGTRVSDSIQFIFNYPEGELMNTFVYDRSIKQWRFNTAMKNQEGKWIPFGNLLLKRTN